MFLAQQGCGRSPKEIEMGSKVPITPACNNSDDITDHLRHFGHFILTLSNVQCPMFGGRGIFDLNQGLMTNNDVSELWSAFRYKYLWLPQ